MCEFVEEVEVLYFLKFLLLFCIIVPCFTKNGFCYFLSNIIYEAHIPPLTAPIIMAKLYIFQYSYTTTRWSTRDHLGPHRIGAPNSRYACNLNLKCPFKKEVWDCLANICLRMNDIMEKSTHSISKEYFQWWVFLS